MGPINCLGVMPLMGICQFPGKGINTPLGDGIISHHDLKKQESLSSLMSNIAFKGPLLSDSAMQMLWLIQKDLAAS